LGRKQKDDSRSREKNDRKENGSVPADTARKRRTMEKKEQYLTRGSRGKKKRSGNPTNTTHWVLTYPKRYGGKSGTGTRSNKRIWGKRRNKAKCVSGKNTKRAKGASSTVERRRVNPPSRRERRREERWKKPDRNRIVTAGDSTSHTKPPTPNPQPPKKIVNLRSLQEVVSTHAGQVTSRDWASNRLTTQTDYKERGSEKTKVSEPWELGFNHSFSQEIA